MANRNDNNCREKIEVKAKRLGFLMIACGLTAGIFALCATAYCSKTHGSIEECSDQAGTAAEVGAVSAFGIFCVVRVADKIRSCISSCQNNNDEEEVALIAGSVNRV